MIGQDEGPTTRKARVIAGFLRRLLAAACLSVAAARGACATPLSVASPLSVDFSVPFDGPAASLDETAIVDFSLSMANPIGEPEGPSLTPDPGLDDETSSANLSSGLGAFEGSDAFHPEEPAQQTGITISAGAVVDGILPDGPGQVPKVHIALSDLAMLILTGMAFIVAGSAGRSHLGSMHSKHRRRRRA